MAHNAMLPKNAHSVFLRGWGGYREWSVGVRSSEQHALKMNYRWTMVVENVTQWRAKNKHL